MEIEDVLNNKFGPLMSVSQLAGVLHRSPDSLRIGLKKGQDWAVELNLARVKMGRRVYFRTAQVAEVLKK